MADGGNVARFMVSHMIVSPHKGTPIQTLTYYNPYYGDPEKVPLILGNPQILHMPLLALYGILQDSLHPQQLGLGGLHLEGLAECLV